MAKKFCILINKKINKFNKRIKIPGDKSCSIRAILLATQCIGQSKIKNLLESEDVLNCINILKTSLNVKIFKKKNLYFVQGNGLNSFNINNKITKIFVGNSGTTARLLSGLLSTYPNKFYLHGDQSMNKRDFTRVAEPLEKIGVGFHPKNKKTLPLIIEGTNMPLAQKHVEKKGSAQIKSLILLSALSTPGITTIEEKKISRNHTEILLKEINADIKVKKLKKGNLITLKGQKNLHSFNYTVSSDPSSAAFLIALTILTPGSKLTIDNVLCNETRIFFVKILKKLNANIEIKNLRKVSGELVGSINVKSSKLKPIIVSQNIGKLIDELPILFMIAALTKGISKFKNIGDLKNKESNRLMESKKILIQAGIKCKITKDSMVIFGRNNIESKNKSIVVKTKGDHRICMSAAIFSLVTNIKTEIKNFETVNTSFPDFIPLIKNLGGNIEIK
ncbi:3-phosphoshikimate 1-carboxyvinyltransferase [Pelagibacteraceae bacterium]|jgi:3-phosphoshikimate 1-carboxyvinyltransferase|nr:3-phosphoshikimate 1-carboxyvinyltransferase [Pelagibacteraceae bacterium]